jgi:hypothetical protein
MGIPIYRSKHMGHGPFSVQRPRPRMGVCCKEIKSLKDMHFEKSKTHVDGLI